LGSLNELESLAIEIKYRLYDDVLMKSPLWVELTENQVKKKKRNWISPAGENQHDQDPRSLGLGGEDTNGLTNTEIIQKQILHFYNQ
jgi:hypothetical protein